MMFVTVKLSERKTIDLKFMSLTMSGLSGLLSRMKKCQNIFNIQNTVRKQSIVYMDKNGEIIWEDGVEYNETGVLAVPTVTSHRPCDRQQPNIFGRPKGERNNQHSPRNSLDITYSFHYCICVGMMIYL